MYAGANAAVLVWSMGITQHERGADNVAAITNLGLARGNVGRRGAGLMPIRGHSGVQGGAEMGAYATVLPGGVDVTPASAAALSDAYGFAIGERPGLTAAEMIEAAWRGDLEMLYSSGGNFLEVLPDPELVHDALRRVPLRVHQDIVMSSQMLVDPGDDVVLLPAATRYEQRDGGTETTTERRIIFSPEIPGSHPGRGAQRVGDLRRPRGARRSSTRAPRGVRLRPGDPRRDRARRAVVRGRRDAAARRATRCSGAVRGCAKGNVPTPDGKAHFFAVAPSEPDVPEGSFLLSTRRGKQFNTMVHAERDPLTGAHRDSVFMARADTDRLGLADGDRVFVRSDHGELRARVLVSELRPGNVQVLFPEGNVLLGAGRRDPASGVPDYNAVVTVERV